MGALVPRLPESGHGHGHGHGDCDCDGRRDGDQHAGSRIGGAAPCAACDEPALAESASRLLISTAASARAQASNTACVSKRARPTYAVCQSGRVGSTFPATVDTVAADCEAARSFGTHVNQTEYGPTSVSTSTSIGAVDAALITVLRPVHPMR